MTYFHQLFRTIDGVLVWRKIKKDTYWRRRVNAFHTFWPSYLLAYMQPFPLGKNCIIFQKLGGRVKGCLEFFKNSSHLVAGPFPQWRWVVSVFMMLEDKNDFIQNGLSENKLGWVSSAYSHFEIVVNTRLSKICLFNYSNKMPSNSCNIWSSWRIFA